MDFDETEKEFYKDGKEKCTISNQRSFTDFDPIVSEGI